MVLKKQSMCVRIREKETGKNNNEIIWGKYLLEQ